MSICRMHVLFDYENILGVFSGKVRPFVAISVGAVEIILYNIVNLNWTERQDREAIQTFYIYTYTHFFALNIQ